MITYKLPDTLSALLTLALDDLEKVEQRDDYVIDMGVWHSPRPYGICRVCLAGAVLVGQGFPKDKDYNDTEIDQDTSRKLDVINSLRLGMVGMAARQLGVRNHFTESFLHRSITHYTSDPVKSKEELRALAAELKEAGL